MLTATTGALARDTIDAVVRGGEGTHARLYDRLGAHLIWDTRG